MGDIKFKKGKNRNIKYSIGYIAHREKIVEQTLQKRIKYRGILQKHLKQFYGHGLLKSNELRNLKEVNFILSGSRGGSSVVVDILKQQACTASSVGKKILSIPGEEKPYMEIAKLTPPFKDFISDKLNESHAKSEKADIFLSELTSEIGWPLKKTTDLRGFAITIYGRLLMQWPSVDFGAPESAIKKIEKSIKKASKINKDVLTYDSEVSSDIILMKKIKNFFPDIDLKFYDRMNNLHDISSGQLYSKCQYFIEEPPFIIPSPWHFVTTDELAQGILILKDPSDAWRIPFWKELLKGIRISWTHLTRNAYESINGLCDGWKFPYGYITTKSPKPLQVKGYTNPKMPWTKWYAKYSTSDEVWKLLLNKKPVDLERIAREQWVSAHQAIIDEVGGDKHYYRIADKKDKKKIGFEWLRSKPNEAFGQICDMFQIELSSSLKEAVEKITTRAVQVTPGSSMNADRWKHSQNYDKIILQVKSYPVVRLSKILGYPLDKI